MALSYAELGDVTEAERSLGLAANVASVAPTPTRARKLELWRGIVRARPGDAEGMRRLGLERRSPWPRQGRASARCEVLARLAIELPLVPRPATRTLLHLRRSCSSSPSDGDPPASSSVAPRARDVGTAGERGTRDGRDGPGRSGVCRAPRPLRSIRRCRRPATRTGYLEIVIPAFARAIFAGGPPEVQGFAMMYLRLMLARIAHGLLDEEMRVRSLKGRLGRELVELAGSSSEPARLQRAPPGGLRWPRHRPSIDRVLFRLLTEGHTNAEMAAKVDLTVEAVGVRLAKLLVGLGVSNRAEATTLAFKGFAR